MNEFVRECRREWKRLRVPDGVADEMASDLQADLEDAAAEGVAPEEVLGSAAPDPRSFAASWAAERGVVSQKPGRLRGRSPMLAAIAAALSIAAVAAGTAIVVTPTNASSLMPRSPSESLYLIRYVPHSNSLGLGFNPFADVTPVLANRGGTDSDTFAWILLAAGIGGLAVTGLYWLRIRPRYRLRF